MTKKELAELNMAADAGYLDPPLMNCLNHITTIEAENLHLRGLRKGDILPTCHSTHFACDCQIKRMAELEARVKELVGKTSRLENEVEVLNKDILEASRYLDCNAMDLPSAVEWLHNEVEEARTHLSALVEAGESLVPEGFSDEFPEFYNSVGISLDINALKVYNLNTAVENARKVVEG